MELKPNRISRRWMRMALINFCFAAFAGLALRYKLTFPFPLIEFKNLLHAHSHFAFAGWASTALFALVAAFFLNEEQLEQKKWKLLFLCSQFLSYGMLIGFLFQEYGPFTIAISTGYILVTYAFAFQLWRDTRLQKQQLSVTALRAALVFLLISSFGPYALAFFKGTGFMTGALYHNSIYWYLHFQYNGWLSFAVFALFLRRMDIVSAKKYQRPFYLLLFSCIPVYLLSILWIVPPLWVYIVAGTSGLLQLAAWAEFILVVRKHSSGVRTGSGRFVSLLFLFALIAFSIKLFLQLLSVFPALNHFVFGHRPVIIGYLHLVLLGFVSFFVLALALAGGLLSTKHPLAKTGLFVFISGVLFNEGGLMLQGFSGILEIAMRWVPYLLFAAALVMFTGLVLFAIGQFRKTAGQRLPD